MFRAMKTILGTIILLSTLCLTAKTVYAKQTASLSCSVDAGNADFNFSINKDKVQTARYFDGQARKHSDLKNSEITISDKTLKVAGVLNNKDFILEVDLESDDFQNGTLKMNNKKPQTMNCFYAKVPDFSI
jgi:hypothetical protein